MVRHTLTYVRSMLLIIAMIVSPVAVCGAEIVWDLTQEDCIERVTSTSGHTIDDETLSAKGIGKQTDGLCKLNGDDAYIRITPKHDGLLRLEGVLGEDAFGYILINGVMQNTYATEYSAIEIWLKKGEECTIKRTPSAYQNRLLAVSFTPQYVVSEATTWTISDLAASDQKGYTSDALLSNGFLKIHASTANPVTVRTGDVYIPNRANFTNGTPDSGVSFKVSGSGIVTVSAAGVKRILYYNTGNNSGNREIAVNESTVSSFVYGRNEETDIYLTFNNGGSYIHSITWTPLTISSIDIKNPWLKTMGVNEVYDYPTPTATFSDGTTVDVNLNPAYPLLIAPSENSPVAVAGNGRSMTATSAGGGTMRVQLKGATATYTFDGMSTNFAISEQSETFDVSVTSSATTPLLKGESDKIPSGWALHFDENERPGGDNPKDTNWAMENTRSGGSRMFTFPPGGITDNGFYLADRNNGPTQLMTANTNLSPTLPLPAGNLKFTLLATGWEGLPRSVEYTIETSKEGGGFVQIDGGSGSAALTTYVSNRAEPINSCDRITVELPNVAEGKYYLKIHNNSSADGVWSPGIIILGYEIEQILPASTELQSVEVDGCSTAVSGNVYTYSAPTDAPANSKYNLSVATASPTASVEIAGPCRAVNEQADGWAAPGLVALPNIPGVSNYYCIRVTDGSLAPAYYWVEVQRPAAEGEPLVMGREMGWAVNEGYAQWTNTGDMTSGTHVVQDGYIKVSTLGKKIHIDERYGLYFDGGGNVNLNNPANNNLVAEIRVSGNGTLKIKTSEGNSTTSTSQTRTLYVKMPNATYTELEDVESGKTVISGTGVHEINYNGGKPTSIFLYSKTSGLSINTLAWIPAKDAGQMPVPEIYLPYDKYRIESGQTLAREFGSASYHYGNLSSEIVYTVKSGGEHVGLTDGTVLTPDAGNNLSFTGLPDVTESKYVVITASLPATNDHAAAMPKDFTLEVYPRVTSVKFNYLAVNKVELTADDRDMYIYEVESTTALNTTCPMVIAKESASASVQISNPLRATTASPENLDYEDYTYSMPIRLPDASGFSNYYYLKVTDGSNTKYYCVRMHRKAGTGELEVMDRPMGWTTTNGDGYGNWTATGNKMYTTIVQDNYIRGHMDDTSNRAFAVNSNGLWFHGSGTMDGTGGFANMVAEIRVSGSGSLRLVRNEGAKAIRIGIPNENGNGIDVTEASELDYTYIYNGGTPTPIFLSSSEFGQTIHSLVWTPATQAQPANQPSIIWEGTNGFEYGSRNNTLKAKAYYNGTDVTESVSYKVVRGAGCISNSNGAALDALGAAEKWLYFSGFKAGTVMISAAIPASGDHDATISYYTFNITKQVPSLIVDEITTTIGGASSKPVAEYVSAVKGVKHNSDGSTSEEDVAFAASEITYTNSGDGYYTVPEDDNKTADADKKINGSKLGRGKITLTWKPAADSESNKNYRAVTTTADVVVVGMMDMMFTKTTGTGGCGRPYQPAVLCRDIESREKLEGLRITYEIIDDGGTGTTLNADHTAVIPGPIMGKIKIKAHFTRDPKATDINSFYNDANTGSTYFELSTKDAQSLIKIPDTDDYTSSNLAELEWLNETNQSGNSVYLPENRPQFVSENYYISGDSHFRVYPSSRDQLANTAIGSSTVKGIYLKNKSSYISFYAQGSARLELSGFATVDRIVEVWALSDENWSGSADPVLDDGAQLIATIPCESENGTFDGTTAYVDINQPGSNYYFLKTNNGGIYLSTVSWKNGKTLPSFSITPSTYELTAASGVVSMMRDNNPFTVSPFSMLATVGNQTILDISDTNDENNNATLTFSSSNENIAKINPLTGVITPISQGTVSLYVDLASGTVGSTGYGAARQTVTLTISGKVADTFFGDDMTQAATVMYSMKTKSVLSSGTATSGSWLTPTVRDHETRNGLSSAAYTLRYRLEYPDGTPYPASKATVNASTGVVNMVNPADKDVFHVVVQFTSDIYVNQQAYYLVNVVNQITNPSLAYNDEDGMKELEHPDFTNAYGGTPYINWLFYKEREFFIPAEKSAVLTFTIPEPLDDLTMHAQIMDNIMGEEAEVNGETVYQVPHTNYDFNSTTNTMTVTVDAPNTFTVKYVWLRIYNSDNWWQDDAWNGVYKITFFNAPQFIVSSTDPSDTPKTVEIKTSNSNVTGKATTKNYFQRKLLYTTDSSTPTAESESYDGSPISHTSNAVYNIVEAIIPNNGGFTDGTTTFTTSVVYNKEVEIYDNSVISVQYNQTSPTLLPNWNNQLLLPKNATAQNAQLRVMMGTDDTRIFSSAPSSDGSTEVFKRGGVSWDSKGKNYDPGIPYYVDVYKYYKAASNHKTGSYELDSNPSTEYNGDFGGKGTNDSDLPPYMTPVSGAFFRFEPEYNGIVTIWIRQNGASASSAWNNAHKEYDTEAKKQDELTKSYRLTRRPVYIMDDDGRLIPRNTAAYSAGWSQPDQYKNINGSVADVSLQSKLDVDFMWGWNNFDKCDRKSTSLKAMEFYKSKYDFYVDLHVNANGEGYYQKFDITSDGVNANGKDVKRIPITDIVYCDNPDTDLDGQSFVLGGYELPMPNYVRYRIPVKAGKTYYMGGRQTKNAFCAVKFDIDDSANPIDVTISQSSDNNSDTLDALDDGTLVNFTLDRTFTAEHWHPIVLPFSVSETRLREIFGDDVMVLTLDTRHTYEGTNDRFTMPYAVKSNSSVAGVSETADLMFTRHFYQMLYANTPAFIRPTFKWYTRNADGTVDLNSEPTNADPFNSNAATTAKSGITFRNVTYVKGGPKTIDIGGGYELAGTYDSKVAKNIYYMENNATTGNAEICYNNSTQGVQMRATRCWIQRSTNAQNAPAITRIGMTTFTGEDIDNETATAIELVNDIIYHHTPATDDNIYNLRGQRVGNGSLDNLPRGIYILHGRKFVVR